MAKNKTHKKTRHLEGQVKQLQSEIKRLKKSKNLDKDELEYFENEDPGDEKMSPCVHCKIGFMSVIVIAGRLFWKCGSCERTKKV